jgi:hypothetical protein
MNLKISSSLVVKPGTSYVLQIDSAPSTPFLTTSGISKT